MTTDLTYIIMNNILWSIVFFYAANRFFRVERLKMEIERLKEQIDNMINRN